MANLLLRYQRLKLKESLSLSYRYPMACKELGVILRLAYSKSSKSLQSLLFDDVLTAFRLLPLMQTQSAVLAANLLFQSVEAALPKQKRVQATSEFKQAKIAYKRREKISQETKGAIQLSLDVLVHLFSLLDMQSLVSAGMVCRTWNVAANDNYIWQFHYTSYFGESESVLKFDGLRGDSHATHRQYSSRSGVFADANLDWKDAFRKAYLGLPSWRYKFNRGYCGHCNAVVWLEHLKCPNQHSGQQSENQRLRPVSPSQIVKFIIDETSWMRYSSDSDSDSDEDTGFRFWSHIKY